MKIAVLGATRNVGREIVRLALDAGDEVRAYAREPSASSLPPHARLAVHTGELDDEAALRACIEGTGAVLSALGPRQNRAEEVDRFGAALERVTRIMREAGVARLVAISGAGTLMDGETPRFGRRMVRGVMKLVAAHMLASKQREAEVICATDLDWVIVRPPRIVPGPPTGKVRVSLDDAPATSVSRGDVADFMLRAAREATWVRKAPFIGKP
jgi:putative NADH-flavin reductase